ERKRRRRKRERRAATGSRDGKRRDAEWREEQRLEVDAVDEVSVGVPGRRHRDAVGSQAQPAESVERRVRERLLQAARVEERLEVGGVVLRTGRGPARGDERREQDGQDEEQPRADTSTSALCSRFLRRKGARSARAPFQVRQQRVATIVPVPGWPGLGW